MLGVVTPPPPPQSRTDCNPSIFKCSLKHSSSTQHNLFNYTSRAIHSPSWCDSCWLVFRNSSCLWAANICLFGWSMVLALAWAVSSFTVGAGGLVSPVLVNIKCAPCHACRRRTIRTPCGNFGIMQVGTKLTDFW